jgi:hypothetical protein
MKSLSVVLSIMFTGILFGSLNGQNSQIAGTQTAEQVIAAIIKNTGSNIIPKTVDVIKEGDPKT